MKPAMARFAKPRYIKRSGIVMVVTFKRIFRTAENTRLLLQATSTERIAHRKMGRVAVWMIL